MLQPQTLRRREMTIEATPTERATVGPDDRKTAGLANWAPHSPYSVAADGLVHIHSHSLARGVLRAPEVEQNGFGADIVRKARASLMRPPVLFMEGEAHQELRRATARFFAP